MLYKVDGLRSNICACHSWEMTLNVSLEVSFDKHVGLERITEEKIKSYHYENICNY